jgi:hypothetical protein
MGNHLSDEQLALYVDAMVLDKQDQLPEHVEECLECKFAVMEGGSRSMRQSTDV